MFGKRKNDDAWDLWTDQTQHSYQDPYQETQQSQNKYFESEDKTSSKKWKFWRRKKDEDEWEDEGFQDYLNPESGNVYIKEEGFVLSRLKICIIICFCFFVGVGIVGYTNTDFDENGEAYVVSYDLHYERQYVEKADDVYDYCMTLKEKLPQIMQNMSNNSLTTSDEVQEIKTVLSARTDKLSRYTEVPQLMATYNDNLISFSMSTKQMLETMLAEYTNGDYLAWAKKAYSDYCENLESLTVLRGQINQLIYRNVYSS